MCEHQPRCADALTADRMAAHVVSAHPEQGWSLLCNGIVVFDDAGALLPDGRVLDPRDCGTLPACVLLRDDPATGPARAGQAPRRPTTTSKAPPRYPHRGGQVPRAEPLPPAADPRARGTLSVSSVRCQL